MKLGIRTTSKYELVNITDQIQKAVAESGVRDGAVLIFAPHTSAAVLVEEDEPNLKQDFYNLFKEYERRTYQHPDGNAEAHILAGIIGHSCVIPIRDGVPDLGAWQSIFLVELDGPRQRRVTVTFLQSQRR